MRTPAGRGGRLAGLPLGEDRAHGIRIDGRGAADAPQNQALPARRVTLVESDPVGQVLDRIAVEVDLEFVHTFRVVARRSDRAADRVADIDDEHGAGLAAEDIKVRDVQADVLPGNR
jgi:hypothetical protein